MIYTLDDLVEHFTPECLKKGRRLFAEGLAAAPNVQRGGELVTAVMRSSGSRRLRVYVRTLRSGSRVVIAGECSCAKKHNCEHVAAVLLKALASHDALPAASSQGAARPASVASPEARRASRQALAYLLIVEGGRLLIETAVARRLGQESHAIVRHYDPERGASRAPARFVTPADVPLLHALGRLARSPTHGIPVLDDPRSSETLAAMLATGRCFCGDPQWHPPLREAPRGLSSSIGTWTSSVTNGPWWTPCRRPMPCWPCRHPGSSIMKMPSADACKRSSRRRSLTS